MSETVQLDPSSHPAPSGRFVGAHAPVEVSQEDARWQSPTAHSRGDDPTQADWAHASTSVHASPSSHGSEFGVWMQPAVLLQVSVVHGFSSSHERGSVPGMHTPPAHRSVAVHASPSEHASASGRSAGLHVPEAGSQERDSSH